MEDSHSTGKAIFGQKSRTGNASDFFSGGYAVLFRILGIVLIAVLCCLGSHHPIDCFSIQEQETYQLPGEVPLKMTFAEWVGLEKEEKNPENELPSAKPWLSHLKRTFLLCRASEPELTTVSAGGLKNRPLYLLFHNLKIHLA
ncbi:hypothetical protein ADIS_2731 [Lunatimonas lonarensis]|uniref:Uncharacterized protein n=1 Tax=Lunatimonas lonarensis TaxID=1232681 RepID=R7ZRW9_9BACT|nr:hypothetical protein [Lunatimonas lonarensis]EON76860.1 hypothetical protein ADIS_2731 [Lunatimonas lonarensis]